MKKLEQKFPASPGCSCKICQSYCQRPGWWTIEQAETAINKGYAHRMMMEISPQFDFAVLSPAFYGCEGFIATNEGARRGCNFLKNGMCELHSTEILPLECAFCHHDRVGEGIKCHKELEFHWKTMKAQNVVLRWQKIVKLDEKINLLTFLNNEFNCIKSFL